jgi:hypothetical protein
MRCIKSDPSPNLCFYAEIAAGAEVARKMRHMKKLRIGLRPVGAGEAVLTLKNFVP